MAQQIEKDFMYFCGQILTNIIYEENDCMYGIDRDHRSV